MTLTDRDKRVLLFVVPVLVLAAYWFLPLSPQREEASKAAEEVLTQEARRDTAQAKLDAAKNAKKDFSADYTQIVRLGKAIPASVDMPSLIVQLDAAAAGTGIRFTKIKTGERVDSAASATTAPPAAPPGTAPPADPATPAAAGVPGATAAAPAGLETVPLELEFTGNFFNLADFFHRVKRFVRVANANVVVSGRLLTIEGVRWSSDPEIFPRVRAEMKATIYLSPKAQGATAGATPSGPSTTTPATTTTPAQTTPEPAVSPTATASP